ncbi:MAG TPA: nitrophenyl compound nitroreductase subunit ArsF family protein [Candidatus Paceibacterota bacterium]|nr:nitrophenyl compound nitroreductase subunit ArsF family protein [Candidatus Pacearchaeota archaeon]HRZ50626.1 nitrophenyl compound nitroreductase subunit ArsF family protein [Candidatus Paceibacterota bacterium]HSA36477.1 nitrophenyl compound nitroreductase subunit ArsF family protein [Candidatus Paceibacterota bacterium]
MKKFAAILIILGIIVALGAMSAIPKKSAENILDTVSNPQQKDTGNMSIAVTPAQKVEVFLFHRTQRCTTCIAIGKLSGQTIEEQFAPEVINGKVIFREVNIDEPENKALAEKFQASGSSLFINAIRGGSDNIQEDVNVWRLTGDQVAFKNYLAGKINGLLGKQ